MMPRLHRDLSVRMEASYVKNIRDLTLLSMLFQLASYLLVAEVLLWTSIIASAR